MNRSIHVLLDPAQFIKDFDSLSKIFETCLEFLANHPDLGMCGEKFSSKTPLGRIDSGQVRNDRNATTAEHGSSHEGALHVAENLKFGSVGERRKIRRGCPSSEVRRVTGKPGVFSRIAQVADLHERRAE